jgi:hypothetical protein
MASGTPCFSLSSLLADSASCLAEGLVVIEMKFPRIFHPILARFHTHTQRISLYFPGEFLNPTTVIFFYPAGFPNVRINSNT